MVTWQPQAQAHLRNIYRHIAKDSANTAQRIVHELTERTRPLAELPFTGKIVPETNDKNLREVHAHSWRILYQIRQRDVYIIAVLHQRQQFAFEDIQTFRT